VAALHRQPFIERSWFTISDRELHSPLERQLKFRSGKQLQRAANGSYWAIVLKKSLSRADVGGG
jgi:hypothetical protein